MNIFDYERNLQERQAAALQRHYRDNTAHTYNSAR